MGERFSAVSGFDYTPSQSQAGFGPLVGQENVIPREEQVANTLSYGVQGVMTGFADTVGQSIGVLDEGELSAFMSENWPQFGSYYDRNKTVLQTTGDLTGMFIPGIAGTKLFTGASRVASAIKGLENSKTIDRLFIRTGRYEKLYKEVQARDQFLAKTFSHNFKNDDIRKSLVRQAGMTRAGNIVKENVAFELGLYATMNESQTLYPDEFTAGELIAMNAALPGTAAAVSFALTGRQLRASVQSAAATLAREREGLGVIDPLTPSTPQNRHQHVTNNAFSRNAVEEARIGFRQELDSTASREAINFDQLRDTNLRKMVTALDEEIKNDVNKLFLDNTVKEVTKVKAATEAETATVINATRADNFMMFNTVSLEGMPVDRKGLLDILGRRTAAAEKIQKTITKLEDQLKKSVPGTATPTPNQVADDLVAQIAEQRTKLDELNTLQTYVIEPDGAVVPAATRKSIYQDGERKIRKLPETAGDPAIFEVTTRADSLFDTPSKLVGISDDFQLIIPGKASTTKISNINVTRILPLSQDLHSPEFFRFTLHDMAEDWHVFRGARRKESGRSRGAEILRGLSSEVQLATEEWVGSSVNSQMRAWQDAGDPRFTELFDAFEPMRKRLREVADADGTIPLFRGESKKSFEDPRNDLVSMTASPDIARRFGEQIVVRRVPVDDVVMPVGGAGDEFEFIVKGNKARNTLFKGKPGGPVNVNTWEALTLKERSAAYAGYQHAIEAWKPGTKITINAGDHHTRLDAAIELYRIHGDKVLSDLTLPSGTTLQDLAFFSLDKKFKEYTRLKKMMQERNTLNIPDEQILNNEDIRKMLNLPGSTSDRPHPVVALFESLHMQGDTDLRAALGNLTNLRRAMQEDAFFPKMTRTAEPIEADTLTGGMMRIPRNMRPVVQMKRPVGDDIASRTFLQEAQAIDRTRVLNEFATAREKGANIVGDVFDEVMSIPERLAAARNVDGLVEGSQRGGATFVQKSHAVGEDPAMIAMHDIKLATDRKVNQAAGDAFERNHPIYQAMLNPANESELVNFMLYNHARKQGWDLDRTDTFMDMGNNLTGFKLADNKRNRDRWQKVFGEEMPDDALMPSPTTKRNGEFLQATPLALSEQGMQAANAVDGIDQLILRNKNVLASIMGRPQTNARVMHVPPTKFRGKEVVYLFDDGMNFIAPITGRSLQDATELAKAEIAARGGKGKYLNAVDMAKYHDVELDEAFKQMVDYSDPLIQTGPITGRQVGNIPDISQEGFKQIQVAQRQQFESLKRQTREVFFASEIAAARQRGLISSAEEAKTGSAIHQMYVAEITGNPELNPRQMTGKIYNTIESVYDTSIGAAFDKAAAFFKPVYRERIKTSKKEDKIYAQLEEQLGEFNPFGSAMEFAEGTHKMKMPIDMRNHMASLSGLTSLLTLRLFGSGHEYLTLASLPATMPAVISGMKMTDLEAGLGALSKEQGLAQWKARINAWGTEAGPGVAMWNPTKAMMNGTHFMFSKEGREVWREASANGFMDQAVSEMFRTMTAPTEGYWKGMIREKTQWATFLADKSETLARGMSFMTGYKYAEDVLGIADKKAKQAFANNFANKVIGDYSPHNRPRMFQGAAGMPVGLFMTFMWNYFQRLFGYIENGQTRALVTQFATQGAVFGAETVPGFQMYADTFFSNWDGTANPVDALNNRFGTEAAEWFLYGSIGNLPKLFGAEDGLALYSRGDINPRSFPNIFNPTQLPAGQMIGNFFGALKKGFESVRQRGGFDANQMSEIAQMYSTNRFLRNFATLYSGHVVDRQGQVVATSPSFADILTGQIENEIALVARLTGMRTLNESLKVAAHARNRSTDLSRRDRMGQLRDVVRSELRKGKPSDKVIENAVYDYIRYGGSIDNIPNWLTEQFMRATVDKSALDVVKFAGNPQKSDNVMRLLHVLSEAPPAEIPNQFE